MLNAFDDTIEDKELAQRVVDLLTDRQLECFMLFARGISTKEACFQLNITYRTGCTHRQRIKDKLGLRLSEEIAVLGWRVRKFVLNGSVMPRTPRRRRPYKEMINFN